VPIAVLARDAGISARTLQRWHQLYRGGGIVALDPRPRADTGTRRTAATTVAFVERLALTKPRPSLATLHRLAVVEAQRQGAPAPSYSTVREIALALDPPLVTLALEGPVSYRDRASPRTENGSATRTRTSGPCSRTCPNNPGGANASAKPPGSSPQ